MVSLHSEEEDGCLGGAEGRTHAFFKGKGRKKKKEKKKSHALKINLLLLLNCFSSFTIPPDSPIDRHKNLLSLLILYKKGVSMTLANLLLPSQAYILSWQSRGLLLLIYLVPIFCPLNILSVRRMMSIILCLAQTIGTSGAYINKIPKLNQIFHSTVLIMLLNVLQRRKTW